MREKLKCPSCNGTAREFVEDGYFIIACNSRKNCNFYNRRKLNDGTR